MLGFGATSPAIEAPMEGEQGLPVVRVELTEAHLGQKTILYIQTAS